MAYADRSSNSRRTATAIAVAAIQGGLIYAVATGLAVDFIAGPPPPEPLRSHEVVIEPMPLPNPAPTELPETERTPIDESRRDLKPPDTSPPEPLPPNERTSGDAGDIGNAGTGKRIELPEPPPPQPPAAPPRMAKPRNAPASWATPNDYPARDLREGNQGLTRFRLSIGADGKVLNCETIASSGSASLDSATCDKVIRRARFEPARDGYGNGVPGTYAGSVSWQIPD